MRTSRACRSVTSVAFRTVAALVFALATAFDARSGWPLRTNSLYIVSRPKANGAGECLSIRSPCTLASQICGLSFLRRHLISKQSHAWKGRLKVMGLRTLIREIEKLEEIDWSVTTYFPCLGAFPPRARVAAQLPCCQWLVTGHSTCR